MVMGFPDQGVRLYRIYICTFYIYTFIQHYNHTFSIARAIVKRTIPIRYAKSTA
jgi:hypothetical protein